MMSILIGLFIVGVVVFYLAASWKIFEKAGREGWEGIIPVYRIFVLTQITGKPAWWVIVYYLVPLANLIMLIIMHLELAKLFGKSDGFGIGLTFLSLIFYPILGFGEATFKGVYDNPYVLDTNIYN